MGQFGEVAERGRNAPAQLVAVEFDVDRFGEAAELRGDVPCQLVVVEVDVPHFGEVAEGGRDAAAQLVVVEVEAGQVGEAAEGGRDAAAQLVVVEVEMRQAGEAAEGGRNRPREPFVLHLDFRDALGRSADGDAFPGRDGLAVVPVEGSRAAQRVLPFHERYAVADQAGVAGVVGHGGPVRATLLIGRSGRGRWGRSWRCGGR